MTIAADQVPLFLFPITVSKEYFKSNYESKENLLLVCSH